MKKAKIMLSAIAVVAVLGGALAFKANHFSHNIFYSYGATTTKAGDPIVTGCVVPVTTTLQTTAGNVQTNLFTTTFLTNDPLACTTLVTITAAE